MPFCASCGAQVDGKFCPKCGAAIVAGGAAPAVSPGGPVLAATPMADNVVCMLCYILGLITGIIFLVLAPYNQNRTVRFHAFQSIFLNVAIIAVEIAMAIVFHVMVAIAGIFGLLTGIIFPLFGLGCFILWLYLLFSTYQGKTIVLPIIGPLAQKQAQS